VPVPATSAAEGGDASAAYDFRGVSVGSQVVLHSLARAATLNGQKGTVVGCCGADGRYPVEVGAGGAKKRIKVKLANLRAVHI